MLGNLKSRLYNTQNIDFKKIDIFKEITDFNIHIMKLCSLLMTIIFVLMFSMSFTVENYKDNRIFYSIEAAATLLIFLITSFVLSNHRKLVIPVVYSFISVLYFYGIYVGMISQHSNLAVTACLFIVVLPVLFIDHPVRLIFVSVLAAGVNAWMIYKYKDPSIVVVDLTDVLFSLVMGVSLGILINKLRVRSYIREQEVAIERDTDGMTGLWNKDTLVKKITEQILTIDSDGAFFILDLDHFKEINDTFGHSYGDQILIMASECIRDVFREEDITGRFGGDEFIFYMPDVTMKQASEYAEKLLKKLYEEVPLPTEDKGLHGSIGIAMCGDSPAISYDSLMGNADKALYVTKESGRFGYTLYSTNKKMIKRTIEIIEAS